MLVPLIWWTNYITAYAVKDFPRMHICFLYVYIVYVKKEHSNFTSKIIIDQNYVFKKVDKVILEEWEKFLGH